MREIAVHAISVQVIMLYEPLFRNVTTTGDQLET